MSNGAHAPSHTLGTPKTSGVPNVSDAIALLHASADAVIDRNVAQQLVAAADDNPEILVEFAARLSADELAGRRPLPLFLPYPHASDAGVATLTEAERLILRSISVNRSNRVNVLERAHGHTTPQILTQLEARGILAVTGNRLRVIDSGLVAAVHRHSTMNALSEAHTSLAHALADPDDADLRAWHASQSQHSRRDAAAELILAGVERARQRTGPVGASELFEGAAAYVSTARRRGELLVLAAETAWQGGAASRAESLLAQLAGIGLDIDAQQRAARIAGMIALSRGRPTDALHRYLDAVHPTGVLSAELVARAAGIAWWEGRIDWADAVEQAAHMVSADTILGQAVTDAVPAGASLLRGDVAAAGPGLLAALALEPDMDSLRGLCFLGEVAALSGDDAAGLRIHRRAVADAQRVGDLSELPFTLQSYALMLASAGRVWEAKAITDLGLRAASQLDEERRGSFQAAMRSQQSVMLGDFAAAQQWARDALAGGAGGDCALARWAGGRAALMQGDAEAAVELLRAVCDTGDGHPVFRLYVLPDYIEALVLIGDTERARDAFRLYDEWVRAGAPLAAAILPRLRGLVSDSEAAGTQFRAAIATTAGRPFEQARARLQLGRHLRRVRRRVESRDELRTALSVCDSLGIAGWGAVARRELRASGETPPGQPESSDLGVLTAQEMRVAQLVLREDSNRAAAELLGLSTRTIEFHLAKAYAKLGINSRNELARVLTPVEGVHTSQ